MFERTGVEVACEGELVLISIGNFERTIEFDTALRISTSMMLSARAAKRAAGDLSREYRTAGTVHDEAADPKKASRFALKLPPRTKDIEVLLSGSTLNLRIERTTFGIPYQAAFVISQWMRLRGKEARNNAHEKAHWSEIARGAEVRA